MYIEKKIAYISIDVYSFYIHKRRNIIYIFFCTLSVSFAVIFTEEHLGRTCSVWELGTSCFPSVPLCMWVCRLLAVRGLPTSLWGSVDRLVLCDGGVAWSLHTHPVRPVQCPLARGTGGCPSWMCVCPTEEVPDGATSEQTPVPRGRRRGERAGVSLRRWEASCRQLLFQIGF